MSQVPDPGEWANTAIVPVLETLGRTDIAVSAGAIRFELERDMRRPPSRSTVTRAIRTLRETSLVRKPDEEKIYYELTDAGRQYVNDRLSDR